MMEIEKIKARYRGCLLGGAAGDVLGDKNQGLISAATQMTMFTAEGLLQAESRFIRSSKDYIDHVALAYTNWYSTQINKPREAFRGLREDREESWLLRLPQLYSCRLSDTTCLDTLSKGVYGTIANPINSCQGNGGIMRIAPVGLFFDDSWKAAKIAADLAALTHGHPLGYLSAAVLAYIIATIIEKPELPLLEVVREALRAMTKLYKRQSYLEELLEISVKAVTLSKSTLKDSQAIKTLGEGKNAEETLAIALYCCLKYEQNFLKAVMTANRYTEADSCVGAIAGNILGAYLGDNAIPQEYLGHVELKQELVILADDLCKGVPYPKDEAEVKLWASKYLDYSFIGA